MNICKNCGVGLERDRLNCPLCGEGVAGKEAGSMPALNQEQSFSLGQRMIRPQRKFTREIVSIILLSLFLPQVTPGGLGAIKQSENAGAVSSVSGLPCNAILNLASSSVKNFMMS